MRSLLKSGLVAACVFATSPHPPVGPVPAPTAIAFEHVSVLAMTAERVDADQTVVVEGGTIRTIGPAATVTIPAGAIHVDGHGRFLMPGLVDMHVHIYDDVPFLSYLASGVTTVANLNGYPEVLHWRDEIAAGRRLGPTIYSTGPSLNGYPPGNLTFVALETPEAARAAVAEQVRAGYDFLKVYSTLGPDVYDAILAEARSRRIAVLGHIPTSTGIDGVLERRYQSNIAHGEEFLSNSGASPDDTSKVRDLARRTRAAGITVTPNLFAYSDYLHGIADLPGVLRDPEMAYASPALLSEKLPKHNRSVRSNPQQFADFLRRGHAWIAALTKALSDAGVPLLVGTDTEIFGYPGTSAVSEMEEMAAAGLTPYQVLVAATRAAGAYVRRFVHPAERFGVVEVGARADLLLLDANPLKSVGSVRKIAGVMARGRWLPRATLKASRDSIRAVMAPQRLEAQAIDSLIHAGLVGAAAARYRAIRTKHPGAYPLAEVVLQDDAERLFDTKPRDALTLLSLAAETYPLSFSVRLSQARAELAVGDSAGARRDLAASIGLEPWNAGAQELDRQLGEAGRPPTAKVEGSFQLVRRDPPPRPGTPPDPWKGRLTIARKGPGYHATLTVGSTVIPLKQVMVAGDRLWAAAARYPNELPELTLQFRGDSVVGRVAGGFGSNHLLVGRRTKAP